MHRIGFLKSALPLDGERALLSARGVDDVELFDVPADQDRVPLSGALTDADGLVIEWGEAPASLFQENPQLKCVSDMYIGYDNIDVEAATENGTWVTNVPGYCSYDVALHTLGLIVDLYRKISFRDRLVRSGKWDDTAGYPVWRPSGQIAGLIYFGSIAKELVPMLQGIGMKVLVYAPTKTKEYLARWDCEKAETVDGLFSASDVVSLHCPLTPETTNIVNSKTLALMKPSAFLVNTARGGCVNEDALAAALHSGTIQAAAVDVLRDETKLSSALIGLSNCTITPHAAYLSMNSYQELRKRAFLNCLAAVMGEVPADPVNDPRAVF
ncbi:MAG: C-terminal binding protein [Atopobiaceae bacterium]|jgi:D-3-phosphoglycerate dehydrogenase|nr:C-terminal binding protein [Olegusella sp.]MCI1934288.1 C-terminal binding protein [Atopobiaceae bacterium]